MEQNNKNTINNINNNKNENKNNNKSDNINNSNKILKKKKKVYLFDLDDTLYQNIDNECRYANVELIKKLEGTKIIFSNAKHFYCLHWLNKMGMSDCFQVVIASDILNGYKPYPIVYLKLMSLCGLTHQDDITFFDNLGINLETAKKLNWKTVLIHPDVYSRKVPMELYKYNEFIDEKYPNLDLALQDIINN